MSSTILKLSFLLLFPAFVKLSQVRQDSVKLKTDTDQVLSSRSFGDPLRDKYQGEEFNYDTRVDEAQNLLQRSLQWFFQTLQEHFGITIPPGTYQVLEYLIYLLMAILVLYLLVRFFVGENLTSLFNKPAAAVTGISHSEEHIVNVDLEALLTAAILEKEYRLAIRYQYLKALKLLSQKNIIEWHYEKTNGDYLKEIEVPTIRSIFREVSYLYDYIWYGEQEINEVKYHAAEIRFAALRNQIP
ncbi:MAG TPA: DUF4129 domain-containing protein, partial [Eudoraea sp.]|nr:DUF4129 domain-containing protein [Eudoraea sp.]